MSADLTWEDFQQHYKDTYFRIVLSNLKIKVVVYFSEVLNNSTKSFVARTDKMKDLILKFDSALSTDFSMPPVRMFEYNGMVYSFERMPSRQWARGVNNKNSRVHCPFGGMGVPNPLYSFPLLQAAWEHVHSPTIIDAIPKLNTPTQVGVTLTDNLWISDGTPAGGLLWYNGGAIGYIDAKNKVIEMKFGMLTQEVQDYLLRSRQENWRVL